MIAAKTCAWEGGLGGIGITRIIIGSQGEVGGGGLQACSRGWRPLSAREGLPHFRSGSFDFTLSFRYVYTLSLY